VDVQLFGKLRLDAVEEFAELDRPMASADLSGDPAGDHLQSCKERRGAMAHLIADAPSRLHGSNRKQVFIRSEQLLYGDWIHVRPNDVAHVLDKQWVPGSAKV
jgi:hypothetical protein